MSTIVATLDRYGKVQEKITAVNAEIKALTANLTAKKSVLTKEANDLKALAKDQAKYIPEANRHALKGQTYQMYHQTRTDKDWDALVSIALAAGVSQDAIDACVTTKSVWGVRKNTNK